MKKLKYILCLAVIIPVLCLGSGSFNKVNQTAMADGGTLKLKSALNTVKIMRNESITALDDAEIKIELAKNESDGGQFIICSPESAKYDVSVGELKCGSDKIPSENITVYSQVYTNVITTFTKFPNGYYPDALIPLKYMKACGENELTANKNQGIWIDVKAPENINAGTYTGNITVKVGTTTKQIPMSVTVFDFALNSVKTMKSCYMIWRDWLSAGELDNTLKKYKDYYDTLLEYNVCAYTFPSENNDVAGYIACLDEYYEKVPSYGIPYTLKTGDSVDYDKLYAYLYEIADKCVKDGKNYFDKAYYYFDKIYDEIAGDFTRLDNAIYYSDQTEERVANAVKGLSEDMKKSLLGLKHVVPLVFGSSSNTEYEEVANCPLYSNFLTTENLNKYYDLANNGDEVWSYGCGAAGYWPYPSRLVDDYLITARDMFWTRYDYNVVGDLYWNVNAYVNFGSYYVAGYARLRDLYTQASHENVTSGDGYLLYPGRPYGSEKPFPSLRMLAIRDGIDDYEYMAELEREYKNLASEYGADTDNLRAVMNLFNKQIYGTGISQLNFEGLGEIRKAYAHLLELAKKDYKFLIENIEVVGDKLNLTCYTASGCKLKIDGQEYTGTTVASGKKYELSVNLTANGISEIEVIGYVGSSKVKVFSGKAEKNAFSFDDINKIKVSDGSSVTLNTNTDYALTGSSAKITLNGKIYANKLLTEAFKPTFELQLSEVDKVRNYKLELYNPSSEDFKLSVGVLLSNGIEYMLNTVILKANAWTTVYVDNFQTISTDASKLANIDKLCFYTQNLVSNNVAYSRDIYLGEVTRTDK